MNKLELMKMANEVRKGAITAVHSAKSGHPGGSLSAADIYTYLYFEEMNVDPKDPKKADRDRFVLSKGHTAPGYYATLANKGFFPVEDLTTLRKVGSYLQGHPDMKHIPGVDMSSGSLGQGISAAVGMAISAKLNDASYRVYTLLGDGEIQEGQVWEAAMLAGHRKLDNLVVIVDNNNLQIDGTVEEVNSPYPIDKKFEAFNFHVINIDGHDFDAIDAAFKEAREIKGQPTAIIAKTVKGKGVSFMENQVSWHGSAPNDEQYAVAMADLEKVGEALCQKIATRESYGNALVELGKKHDNVVVLDADLAAATKTGIFKKAFPERHIDCGIAESNMIGVAAGLATTGMVPFASSFAMFAAGRAFEQVRNSVGYPKLNVKIGATHAGISVGEDGATHQCNEDIALMRTIPGMVVINPADDVEAKAAVEAAYEHVGPVYLRFGRLAVPVINDNPDYKFELGKAVTLREGTDVTIIASGLTVSESLVAAEKLAADGISAEVINMHTIKPLDEEAVIKAAAKTGKIVTAEEHSVIGGLGSAVCDVVAEKAPAKVLKIGVNDTYGESGPAVELIKKYGLDADSIYEKVKAFV
mgnify:CR=1 FL=1